MTPDPTGHATPAEFVDAFLSACQALGIPSGAQIDTDTLARKIGELADRRDAAARERDSLARRLGVRYQELEQARVVNARLRERAAAATEARDEALDRERRVRLELTHWRQVIVPEIRAERDTATEARQQLAGGVRLVAEKMRKEIEAARFQARRNAAGPSWTAYANTLADFRGPLDAALAATAPPAAPSEDKIDKAMLTKVQDQINKTVRDLAAVRSWYGLAPLDAPGSPPAPDQGMVREAGGARPDCCSYPTPKAYEQAAARTAGDEHLQALRRIAAVHQAHDASPADLAGLVEGIAATLDRLTAERDEARQEAERLRGEVQQRADDLAVLKPLAEDVDRRAQALIGEVHKIADWCEDMAENAANPHAAIGDVALRLRALASTGGSDTTDGGS